jgi:CheY-like chemotaxis protein
MNQKQILIIDDEAPMRYLLERQLCRAGYGVRVAGDGETGLALAAERPDLIILDILMPGLDGFAVFERLQRSPELAGIPVVFLSASITAETRHRAFALGAADVLAKPLRADELTHSVASVFSRAAQREEAPGRIVAFLSIDGPGGAAAEAIRFSRAAALQSPAPVLLLDLEFPYGAIGSRLGLRASPNVLDVFASDPAACAPVGAAVWEAAQRLHAGLRVLPACGAAGEPFPPDRMMPALDDLVGSGHTIVLNLGNDLTDLNRQALCRADLIGAVGRDPSAAASFEGLVAALCGQGVATDKWLPLLHPAGQRETTMRPNGHTGERRSSPAQPLEPALS